jgi:hypothetical protein
MGLDLTENNNIPFLLASNEAWEDIAAHIRSAPIPIDIRKALLERLINSRLDIAS